MKLSTAIRRTGRGDTGPVYALVALLVGLLLAAAPTIAYTSTHHNLAAAAITMAVTWILAIGLAARAMRREHQRVQAQTDAAQARAEAEWLQFIETFPAALRGAVTQLCDDTARAAAFGEVCMAPPAIVHSRTDRGVWPTNRGGAVVRLAGIDCDAFTRTAGLLADALGLPAGAALTLRRTRRKDGACELHLTLKH